MQPAADGLAKAISGLKFNDAQIPIIANTNAQPITAAEAIKDELRRQLLSPVRWQASVEYMTAHGVNKIIEIGPGKVLTGLVKRINKDIPTANIVDAETAKNSSQL